MATPLLNEMMIIDTLDVKPAVENIDRLCSAAVVSVLDMYDRKVLRDPFMNVLGAANGVHWFLGRLAIISAMQELMKADKLTPDKLEEAAKALVESADAARLVLVNAVKMASLCPLDEDRVH